VRKVGREGWSNNLLDVLIRKRTAGSIWHAIYR
jgi:hypothetical protein